MKPNKIYTVDLNGQEWKYWTRNTSVKIQSPSGFVSSVSAVAFSGIRAEDAREILERGTCNISSAQVKKYIQQHLL